MIELRLGSPDREGLTVLLVGAHADDIEIGCGGTVLKLLRQHPDVSIHWVVLSAAGPRESEARRSAERFLRGASQANVSIHGFRDGSLPWQGEEVKAVFESLKGIDPDLIFTHHGADRHQDHRLVSELTWQTFRSHTVLEYEIPKYDGDLGNPNVFVPLDDDLVRDKVDALMEAFQTQRAKRWFTPETFQGLMRIRGIESPGPCHAAEAFHSRKIELSF